jgi:hypothetical protein
MNPQMQRQLHPNVLKFAPWIVASLLAAAGYARWAEHPVVFDDAYITYRYADNLATGHGPVYNIGERVEGYTNFSWMLLAAAGIYAGQDPLDVTRAAGLASHAAVLFIIGFLFARWLVSRGLLQLLLLPLLSLLVLPVGFAAMAGSGLETGFVEMLLVATGVLLYTGDFSRWRSCAALAFILSLSILTRMDSVFSTAAAMLALLISEPRDGRPFLRAVLPALRVGIPVALVVAAWTLFRLVYYGDLLPNTYYAKAADHVHVTEGLAYLVGFYRSYPASIPLMLLALAGFASTEAPSLRLTTYAAITLCAEAAYIVKVGGDFMEYRFAWQLYGLMVLAAARGLLTLATHSTFAAAIVVATTLSVADAPLHLEQRYQMQSLDQMNGYAVMGEAIGRRFAEVLPPKTIISTTLAGTIAYFGKRVVVDQWGLNDAFVAHLPWNRLLITRGHVKFAPLHYLRSRHVNLYVGHPVVCSCAQLCRENLPNVFVKLSEERCLRTWYLTPTPALTKYFCANPARFVLNNVSCPLPPSPGQAARGRPINSEAAGSLPSNRHTH